MRTGEMRSPKISLDEYIVMPNHFHGIVIINDVGAQRAAPEQRAAPVRKNEYENDRPHVKSGSLGAIVRGFKSAVTRRINLLRNAPARSFWQRNYYDHIIRGEEDLENVRLYIQSNPYNWAEDDFWGDGKI